MEHGSSCDLVWSVISIKGPLLNLLLRDCHFNALTGGLGSRLLHFFCCNVVRSPCSVCMQNWFAIAAACICIAHGLRLQDLDLWEICIIGLDTWDNQNYRHWCLDFHHILQLKSCATHKAYSFSIQLIHTPQRARAILATNLVLATTVAEEKKKTSTSKLLWQDRKDSCRPWVY